MLLTYVLGNFSESEIVGFVFFMWQPMLVKFANGNMDI